MFATTLLLAAAISAPQSPRMISAAAFSQVRTPLLAASERSPEFLTIDLKSERRAAFDDITTAYQAPTADADERIRSSGFYVELDLGFSSISGETSASFQDNQDIDFDNTTCIGGAIGYRFTKRWRLEANISHRESDVDTINGVPSDGETSLSSYTANMYFDLLPDAAVRPYIGYGMGFSDYSLDTPISRADDDAGFAWSLLLGASCRIADQTELNLGFRRVTSEGLFDDGVEATEFIIGLRYSF